MRFILSFLAICSFLGYNTFAQQTTYTNPIISKMGLADPDVFYYDGTYYLSGTEGGSGYWIYTSQDLVHWKKEDKVFETEIGDAWAPDFWYNEKDGYFYIYTSEDFTINVARSKTPTGTYQIQNTLVNDAIDAHLYQDTDGQLYLFYVKHAEEIWARKMKSPTEFADEDEVFIMTDDHEWETPRNEGPFIIKRDSTYYLIYSGNNANNPAYAIGYATSDKPLGPYKKYEGNPIAKKDPSQGIYGPGHGVAIQDEAGNYWYVYHQKMDNGINYNRKVCIDPIHFDEKGHLLLNLTHGTEQNGPIVD